MDERKNYKTFPRVSDPLILILFGGWGLFIAGSAIWGISDGFTDWKLPFWRMDLWGGLFIAVFMLFWFGFIGVIVWFALRPLQQVRVAPEEVSIWFGPICLQRLIVAEIKTVVATGQKTAYCGNTLRERIMPIVSASSTEKRGKLILSTISAEELREQSRSLPDKQRLRLQALHMGDELRVSDRTVKHYIQKNHLLNRFWVEWTPQAEEILRKQLTTTVFIL